ncbi:MAG: hypothetical protein KF800_09610 [Lysobacter sp.]|nr:hypothetical protein [Lysobacter sp.]
MSAGTDILKSLCDRPEDFEINQSVVAMRRHGEDLILELQKRPGLGEVVVECGGNPEDATPLKKFVQKEILRLPKLALQIRRSLEQFAQQRPAPYVDGPAQVEGSPNRNWEDTKNNFLDFIQTQEVGSTRLILLMADAGQGKTVFLESAALEASGTYFPEEYPRPLILPVDLLGRYVGTIDDAIAGSLNNTYVFPGLTQRDVIVSVQNGWLILALDGFDELVARIGARDSFIRVTELIDQLAGAGTILLSARKSFFEMQEVSNAIRSYLRPKAGAYSAVSIRLAPWERRHAVEVFKKLGSRKASDDVDGVFGLFDDDEGLLSEPFFLTRVAKMWLAGGGEGISLPGGGDKFAQAEYLIQEFTKRETEEKWGSNKGHPLLSKEQHALLLGAIAQEMWMSAAFRLTADELSIAVDIGLNACGLEPDVIDQVKARIATHGALTTSGRYTQFRHQRFFSYFFAKRVTMLMLGEHATDLAQVVSGPELGPEILGWIEWMLPIKDSELKIEKYLELYRASVTDNSRSNAVALLCIWMNEMRKGASIDALAFVGDVMKDKVFYSTTFRGCGFWHVDLSGSQFHECVFERCEFGDVKVDGKTSFMESTFEGVVIQSVEEGGAGSRFAPEEISELLSRHGAKSVNQAPPARLFEVDPELIRVVERFVRRSVKLWDIALEDFEEECGELGGLIVRTGLEVGVLKEISKATSGPKKRFVRLQVDRDELSSGWRKLTNSKAVRDFWEKLSK